MKTWKNKYSAIVSLLVALLLAALACSLVMDGGDHGVPYASVSPERMSHGPGTSAYYWNTYDFRGMTYVSCLEGLVTEYEVRREDDYFLYDRACRRSDGELVFRYSAVMSGDDYRDMMDMLHGLRDNPARGQEDPSWTLTYDAEGGSVSLSGMEDSDEYGSNRYGITAWLNGFEMGHGNLYGDDAVSGGESGQSC